MVSSPQHGKKVVIEPVTRIEGHAKVTIHLNEKSQVQDARLHIIEFRGFERFVRGRMYWEAPVIVQRLCGICPISHHLCAAKAMDRIVGADVLPPTAEKIRRLMHYGQVLQSHAVHFFHLASPDLLFGFDADPAVRNVLGVAARHKDIAVQGVMLRKFGQEVIRATAGKRIHGTGAIPGGVNRSLSDADRDAFRKQMDQQMEWARGAVKIARDYTVEHLEELVDFGSFPSNHMGLVREDGALELYDGPIRTVDAEGKTLLDDVDVQDYLDYIAEDVRPWSYMKFPFLKSLGPETGWYRVGPLARLNVADFIDSPEAEAARTEFFEAVGPKPCHVTMAYHWARMIELLHAAEKIRELLDDADIQGDELTTSGERRPEAAAVLEAPRGTLFHHYRVDENDQIQMANLIVATTNNNDAMNASVRKVAQDFLSGTEITEGLLNRVEVAIRAYDPCLSCATHALGQMPLRVDLYDAAGRHLDGKAKG